MTYFKLTGDEGGEPNVRIKALNNPSARLKNGSRIDDLGKHRIHEVPFRFDMRVRRSEDGTRQEPRFSAYYYAAELMHKDLVKILQDAGGGMPSSFFRL